MYPTFFHSISEISATEFVDSQPPSVWLTSPYAFRTDRYFLNKLVQYPTQYQSQLQDCSTNFWENQDGYRTYSNYQLETEKWIVFCYPT